MLYDPAPALFGLAWIPRLGNAQLLADGDSDAGADLRVAWDDGAATARAAPLGVAATFIEGLGAVLP